MSLTTEAARAWCDKARTLLGAARGKTQDLVNAVAGAEAFVAGGQPPELGDAEWKSLTDAVEAGRAALPEGPTLQRANRMAQRDAHDDTFRPRREGALVEITAKLDAVGPKIKARREALAALAAGEDPADPVKIATALDARGRRALAQRDDPAVAFGKVRSLLGTLAAAKLELAGLTEYITASDAAAAVKEIEAGIKGLDLEDATSDLAGLQAIITDAKAEKEKVGKFKTWLASQSNKAEPGSEADWKTLREKTLLWGTLRSELPKALAYARTFPTKVAQADTLETPVGEAIKNWPALSVPDRLTSHNGPGKLAWIKERIDRLYESPAPTPEELKAKREAKEWQDFLDDVQAKWADFATDWNKDKRGVDIPLALKTAYVLDRVAKSTTVKIGGKTFTKSSSDTAGVSLKTPYPEPPGGYPENAAGQLIASFIYHL